MFLRHICDLPSDCFFQLRPGAWERVLISHQRADLSGPASVELEGRGLWPRRVLTQESSDTPVASPSSRFNKEGTHGPRNIRD